MRVLLINGSPAKDGCTYTALKLVSQTLEENGIETELIHIGASPISGCQDCGGCKATGECVIDDSVNLARPLVNACDGLVLGSPVHYAAISGGMSAFLDRLFFSGVNVAGKPCGCLVSARRAGTTAALEQLWKYPLIAGMPLVSSQYWCMVHGNSPQEVMQDIEGVQIMRTLGRNMAWLLGCVQKGKEAGISFPPAEKPRQWTNFIR